MTGAELELTISKRFANSNAIFFVFFPERHRGTVSVDDTHTIVFRPEGGVDWRVVLDPQTSLPKTMAHKEGDRAITVTFGAYETVDGLTVEKEIHRSGGDPRFGAVIRFTKTVINPPTTSRCFLSEPMKAGLSDLWVAVLASSIRGQSWPGRFGGHLSRLSPGRRNAAKGLRLTS